MSSFINSQKALSLLNDLLREEEAARWATEIQQIHDEYAKYKLRDPDFCGFQDGDLPLINLEILRDFFSELAKIQEHRQAG